VCILATIVCDLANGFANGRSGQPRIRTDWATARRPVSVRVRQPRTDLDDRNLATDLKVGESSPSERATHISRSTLWLIGALGAYQEDGAGSYLLIQQMQNGCPAGSE